MTPEIKCDEYEHRFRGQSKVCACGQRIRFDKPPTPTQQKQSAEWAESQAHQLWCRISLRKAEDWELKYIAGWFREARDQALEEAAQVCEGHALPDKPHVMNYDRGWAGICMRAIRYLKSKEAKT